MPHNRYTRLVRKQERAQIARQEKDLAALDKKLKSQDEDSTEIPVVNQEKVRRSTRIEQKQRHKGKRRRSTDGNQS